jgi:hypothetical protein
VRLNLLRFDFHRYSYAPSASADSLNAGLPITRLPNYSITKLLDYSICFLDVARCRRSRRFLGGPPPISPNYTQGHPMSPKGHPLGEPRFTQCHPRVARPYPTTNLLAIPSAVEGICFSSIFRSRRFLTYSTGFIRPDSSYPNLA